MIKKLFLLKQSKTAVYGMCLILIITLVGIIGPAFTGSPFEMTAESFMAPGEEAILGTDDLGRDMFARVVFGTRISLIVGIVAALTSSLIGIIIGSLAGFFGGFMDEILTRIAEAFQVIPQFFLAILIVALFGASINRIVFVIAILSWPSTARIVRAEFLKIKNLDFVSAARLAGSNRIALIFSEILPNTMPPVIVNSSLQIAGAILTEASLSFLGLGDPEIISWGQLLYNAQPFLRHAWWLALFPGIAISISSLGFNLLGDGLNDVLNPRKRGEAR